MSIFKEHKTSADRSATDRRRHKEKIEKAIREGIHHVVADESIIGQDGKKKIRIPVRGIKEYRFIYGENENNKKVGSAPGKNIARGQQIGKAEKQRKPGQGDQAGNEKGVEYYDVEITLEELAAYLFDSLELPDLERKHIQKIFEKKMQRHGYRSDGIRPRLDKKQTIKKKLKRKAAAKRVGTHDDGEEERFPFHHDDLRYRHIKPVMKTTSAAVIFFMMDISGSMGKEKKYLARSFFFLLYQFVRHRYENVEVVFVAHDTVAYEVNEQQFFTRGQGGGTIVSSGLEMVLDIIEKRFHPNSWNIYSFHCSDGDNWPSDMDKSINLSEKLKDLSQLYSYCQIVPEDDRIRWARDDESTLAGAYSHLEDSSFKVVKIHSPGDIWPAFKRLFGGKLGV
jgi:sporulation protein YhbH